jgi:hypothetical protein
MNLLKRTLVANADNKFNLVVHFSLSSRHCLVGSWNTKTRTSDLNLTTLKAWCNYFIKKTLYISMLILLTDEWAGQTGWSNLAEAVWQERPFPLRLFATALHSEGNPQSKVRHSLLTLRKAKLSFNWWQPIQTCSGCQQQKICSWSPIVFQELFYPLIW